MRPSKFTLLNTLVVGFLFTATLAGCSSSLKKVHFESAYADSFSGNGLYNPERGFRLEVHSLLKKDYGDSLSVSDREAMVSELKNLSLYYASDSVSLAQSYIYLTDKIDRDLTDQDLNAIDYYFDTLRKLGKKAVLRFAYENNIGVKNGPDLKCVLKHIEQLKPVIDKNKDLIYVFQAGFIGAWGEWHSSVKGLDQSLDAKKAILKKILWLVPQSCYVQVRVPEYKNIIKDDSTLYKRVSFHDDFIVVKAHKWDGGMHEGTPAFAQMVKESPYLPVDGELPWGVWSVNGDPLAPENYWLIDGQATARKLFLQHFSSLSIVHNYKENAQGKKSDKKFSMIHWKKTPISKDFLIKNKMPFSSNYFKKKDGHDVSRSEFDYIRDHLGYRIELQDLTSPSVLRIGKNNDLKLTLVNRGFSTLFNNHKVYFVLINEQNQVTEFLTSANPDSWQPYCPSDTLCKPLLHEVTAQLNISSDQAVGKYRLGLWIADGSQRLSHDSRFAIRCANANTRWWVSPDHRYGVNILSEIELKK